MQIHHVLRDVPPDTWPTAVKASLPLQSVVHIHAVGISVADGTEDPDSPGREVVQTALVSPALMLAIPVQGKLVGMNLPVPRQQRLGLFMAGLLHREAFDQQIASPHPRRVLSDLSFEGLRRVRRAETDLKDALVTVLNGPIGQEITQPVASCFPGRQLSVYPRDMFLVNPDYWDEARAKDAKLHAAWKTSFDVRASAGEDLVSFDALYRDNPLTASAFLSEGAFHPNGLAISDVSAIPEEILRAGRTYFDTYREVYAVALYAALSGAIVSPDESAVQ
jgi:hypothetical protein